MIRYFKKSLLVFLAVMMVITFVPGAGLAEKAYATDTEIKSISFTPQEPFVLCENSGGQWMGDYYLYDYYNLMSQEGNALTIYYDNDTCVTYWSRGSYDYFNSNYELLEDFYYYDNQDVTHWEANGEYYFTIEYKEKTCKVPVKIEESPIKSIEFVPAEPVVLYENTVGAVSIREVEVDGNWVKEEYFSYELGFLYKIGNKLIITNKDDSKETYVYSCNDDGDEEFFNDKGDRLVDLNTIDDQESKPWTKGGENYLTVEYLGRTCKVPVKVSESPIKGIEFKIKDPIILYENLEGYWDEYDEDKFFFYDSWYDYLYAKGNQLIVTNKDVTRIVFECKTNDEDGTYDFFTKDGEKLKDWNCADNQYLTHWVKGDSNYITIEYLGQAYKLKVKIIENPVKEVAFETAEPIEVIEETDGHWDMYEVEGFDGSYEIGNYFNYEFNLYGEGNKLIVRYNDGTEKVYVYSSEKGEFCTANGESLKEGDWRWDDKQYGCQYEPGVNHCYVYYKGNECTVDVTVKHNFEEKTIPPTCTEKGHTVFTCRCKNCGYTFEGAYTDPTGHNWGEWTVTRKPPRQRKAWRPGSARTILRTRRPALYLRRSLVRPLSRPSPERI